ncbi:protein RoBo-1-like isoform X2 [Cavia porcellus]|uniref:protein RoBo-1-like isoform X2 n=1 Tax=Cavia porcellus TaxID=10141 RepID=UPI002FE28E37
MPLPSTLKSIFTFCVSAAFLLSTVESYTCTQCFSDECTSNPSKTCETSQGCFSHKEVLEFTEQSGGLYQVKGCSPGACTPLAFSATLGNKMTFSYNRQCCDSEQCNKEDIPRRLQEGTVGIPVGQNFPYCPDTRQTSAYLQIRIVTSPYCCNLLTSSLRHLAVL